MRRRPCSRSSAARPSPRTTSPSGRAPTSAASTTSSRTSSRSSRRSWPAAALAELQADVAGDAPAWEAADARARGSTSLVDTHWRFLPAPTRRWPCSSPWARSVGRPEMEALIRDVRRAGPMDVYAEGLRRALPRNSPAAVRRSGGPRHQRQRWASWSSTHWRPSRRPGERDAMRARRPVSCCAATCARIGVPRVSRVARQRSRSSSTPAPRRTRSGPSWYWA